MKLKSGVNIRDVRPEIVIAMLACESIFEAHGVDMVVTSVKDGRHMPTSLHYEGLAMDLRSKHLNADAKAECLAAMREALGEQFDVLLEGADTENEHFHVEADFKKGAIS